MDGPALPLGRRAAAGAAVVVAFLAAAVVVMQYVREPARPADIDQIWYAARALLAGRDPYSEIGPGRAFDWPWPLYYPLPATVLLMPFAPFPVVLARLAFAVLPAAALAYLLARQDWRWLALFLSRAAYLNVWHVQWSTLFTCALFVPAVGIAFGAKPNLALATLAGFREGRQVRLAVLLALAPLAFSLAMDPGWVPRWLAAVATADHLRPLVLLPGGFVLLLAALRWRRWEGRLLLALALVPQTTDVIGAVPLLLLAKSFRALLILSLLTYVPHLLINFAPLLSTAFWRQPTFADATTMVGVLTLFAVYLPALVVVLRLPSR